MFIQVVLMCIERKYTSPQAAYLIGLGSILTSCCLLFLFPLSLSSCAGYVDLILSKPSSVRVDR